MTRDKKKHAPRRLSRTQRRFLLLIIVLGAVIVLKWDQIQFRLHNLLNPIQGEIVFHAESDSGGHSQIYHLAFNTALKTSQIEQLTFLPESALNPVYSPDGEQIAFQSGDSVYVMDADGSDPRSLTKGHTPLWANDHQIVFQRRIGYYITDTLATCSVNGPFVFDLMTREVSSLYEIPKEALKEIPLWKRYRDFQQGELHFRISMRGAECRGGDSPGFIYLPKAAAEFHPLYQELAQVGLLDHAASIFLSNEKLSPSKRYLIRTYVYPYPTFDSGIEMYINGEWTMIKPVHSGTVAWSPDEKYIVYDGWHPSGRSVIALSSIDGSFTYPLLNDDQRSYFAPGWRP